MPFLIRKLSVATLIDFSLYLRTFYLFCSAQTPAVRWLGYEQLLYWAEKKYWHDYQGVEFFFKALFCNRTFVYHPTSSDKELSRKLNVK